MFIYFIYLKIKKIFFFFFFFLSPKDWVFLGAAKQSPTYADIEKSKTISSFDALIDMSEEDLENHGIQSSDVRSKILAASQGWKSDHQFPGID